MTDVSLLESTRRFYDTVARRRPEAPFLNYGFADLAEPAQDGAAPDLTTVCRRLYQEVLTPFPSAGRVVEIACGRGGGADVLLNAVPSARYLGLDLSTEHLRVCRARLGARGALAAADASRLPLADAAFDAAFSVEAMHHFPDLAGFYREVARVLRPGGSFLLAGLWRPGPLAVEPADAGFRVVERHDITPHVVASLSRTSVLRQQLIESLELPERFLPLMMSWAGVRGYDTYEHLASGAMSYLRYRLVRI